MCESPDTCPQPLDGGRSTAGIVRIGGMVHRPMSQNAPFIHDLLIHLEAVGFAGAPRFRGIDREGREMLTYLEGDVTHQAEPGEWTDEQLGQVAALLRRFHDATAGSPLSGTEEIVCHNDFAPWNTVLVAGLPAAIIDFGIAEQARRIRLMCDIYGFADERRVVSEIARRQQEILDQHTRNGWIEQAQRVAAEIEWLHASRVELLHRLDQNRPGMSRVRF